MLSGDTHDNREQHKELSKALYCPVAVPDWADQIYNYYHHTTSQLIKCNQDQLLPKVYFLDVVKEWVTPVLLAKIADSHSVANPSHSLFVSELFNIPVDDSGDGASTKDFYLAFALLFAYVFLDGDTAKSFGLREAAKKATAKIRIGLRLVVEAVVARNALPFANIFSHSSSAKLLSGYGRHMIERIKNGGKNRKSVDDVIGEILPTAAAAVATQAQAMTQMIDVYLKDEYYHHWDDIRKCAYSDTAEDRKTLERYALEACRLEPSAFGLLRVADRSGSLKDHNTTIKYNAGDALYTNFVTAGRDKAYHGKNADQIDINRKKEDYIHHGTGSHNCIGRDITTTALGVQLGLFAKLKNLKRVPGQAGQLKYTEKLATENPGGIRAYMSEDWSSWWPFPTSELFLCANVCC